MSQNKKKVMGRGLSAILESPDTDITSKDISGGYVAGAIASIPLRQIETNPFQPREDFDEEALRELAESIHEMGVISPITARKMGYDKYQLISGERRLRAAIMAGLEDIPAFIRIANDQQMVEMALVENIQRENLNAMEIALSYQRLLEECDVTQEELSQRVGKNRSTIANYMRLLKLPAELQVALRDGKISMGHARALINLPDTSKQLAVLKATLENELSVRAVEEMVRKLENPALKQKKEKDTTPEAASAMAGVLAKKLDSRVNVSMNAKGHGSIVIKFSSPQQLDRILNTLNG